jgi:MSHA biogenesis protein MshO
MTDPCPGHPIPLRHDRWSRALGLAAIGKRCGGFTLVELIAVIVLTAIVGGMVTVYLRVPFQAFVDSKRRVELADIADTSFRRMARDIRASLPNSVRVNNSSVANVVFIEFIPVLAAGRYLAAVDSVDAALDDPLDFTATDGSFDTIGSFTVPSSVASGSAWVVVANLGIEGANAYNSSENRTAFLGTHGSALTAVSQTPIRFPIPSPNRRFYIVGSPVTYRCLSSTVSTGTGTLERISGYSFSTTQPISFSGASTALLAGKVGSCSAIYDNAVAGRNGLLTFTLELKDTDESVRLVNQIQVHNVP